MKKVASRDLAVARALIAVFKNKLSGFTIQGYAIKKYGLTASAKASGTIPKNEKRVEVVLKKHNGRWQPTSLSQPEINESPAYFFADLDRNGGELYLLFPIC